MTDKPDRPAIPILCERIGKCIDTTIDEWDMTTAEIVGCLEMVKQEIIVDKLNRENGLDKYYD